MTSKQHWEPPRASRKADFKTKLVVVGDGGCGKTSLMMAFVQQPFTDVTPVNHNGKVGEMALWDTAGQEDYDRLRPLSYPESDVIVLCYAVDYPVSYDNIRDKWFPEVSHFCAGVPLVLVATKTDLRQDSHAQGMMAAQGRKPLEAAQGEALAKELRAKYTECSSKTNQGVSEVFDLCVRLAIKHKTGSKLLRRCNIC